MLRNSCLIAIAIFKKIEKQPTEVQKHSPEVFCKKGVLKNFTNFTGKHLCCSLFFNKAAVLQPASFLKRDSNTSAFL